MNWSIPAPWDIEGHLGLFLTGLFWMAIWTTLYFVAIGLRGCWRWIRNVVNEPDGDSPELE